MDLGPRLIDVAVPPRPAGTVVLLHGGASRPDSPMVSPTQLSVLRMIPIAWRVAAAGRRLAVFRLLNSRRGWDSEHTPVTDAGWALARIGERLGALPTCLVGHSLGGRAALLAAAQVRSVVALAPWVYPVDVAPGLDGQRILIVHGERDRVASPQRSAALARTLAARARVGYVSVRDGTHSMVRRHGLFDGLAAEFAASTLLGRPPRGPLARLDDDEGWAEL